MENREKEERMGGKVRKIRKSKGIVENFVWALLISYSFGIYTVITFQMTH